MPYATVTSILIWQKVNRLLRGKGEGEDKQDWELRNLGYRPNLGTY